MEDANLSADEKEIQGRLWQVGSYNASVGYGSPPKKESGVRRELGLTTRNDYILSDPIPTLEEFLLVASEGVFGLPLLAEWNVISAPTTPAANDELPCPQNGDTDVPEMGTPSVPEMGTYKQTLKNKQTSGESMFEDLKFQIGEKVFNRFMAGATLVSKQDGIAIIGTPQAYARLDREQTFRQAEAAAGRGDGPLRGAGTGAMRRP